MKTVKINKNIETILNVTKNVIKESEEFNDYYKNKDNNLYHSQLPLLMQRSRIREALYFKNKNEIKDLIVQRTTTDGKDSNDNILREEEEKNYNKQPLAEIRKLQVRSKKLPPLCPFYNNKGELLPEVVSTSKALLTNFDSDSKFNLTNITYGNNLPNWHFLTPMNKSKIKNINLYENIEIHYEEMQNEVLFEENYKTLKYNYSDIYNRKEYYKELINNLVEEIKKLTKETNLIEEGNKIVKNQETQKEKIFEWGKNKQKISLSLNSINIKIKSLHNSKLFFECNLPINLIPLLYFKDFEKFKLIIMALIQWNEKSQKFEKEQNMYTVINNLLTNCSEFKSKFDLLEDIENKEEKIEPLPELKKAATVGKIGVKNFVHNLAKSMMNIGTGNSNTLFAGTNVDIIQKRKIKKKSFNLNPKKEKEDLYLNYNIINFFWKTANNLFEVSVETPLIIFNIPSCNITIKQYIDFELLFYLFSINFESWDFYIIKYISSFKIFRIILSQMASLNQKKNINIFLEKRKIKNYDFSDEKITNILTLNKNLDISEKPKQKKVVSDFDKILEENQEHNGDSDEENLIKDKNIINTVQTEETFKPTNDNSKNEKKIRNEINTIIEQKCFRALVTVTDMNKFIANEYMIHFNYKQFNKFKFMEKYMDKITFLIKFIDVNYENSTIKFDYDSLNSFKEKAWVSQLEKYNKNIKLNLISDNNHNITNNNSPKVNKENKIKFSPKKNKKKNIKRNSPKKEDEKMLQKDNINNNPNKVEFIGDSNKSTLSVEIKEPAIILKYLENKGNMKLRKFNILAPDEKKLVLDQKNIIDIFNNLCELSQEYIKKDNEKKIEINKHPEKNLFY